MRPLLRGEFADASAGPRWVNFPPRSCSGFPPAVPTLSCLYSLSLPHPILCRKPHADVITHVRTHTHARAAPAHRGDARLSALHVPKLPGHSADLKNPPFLFSPSGPLAACEERSRSHKLLEHRAFRKDAETTATAAPTLRPLLMTD